MVLLGEKDKAGDAMAVVGVVSFVAFGLFAVGTLVWDYVKRRSG